jgi:hypothetical protein
LEIDFLFYCRLKPDSIFPRRQKTRFIKTKPASWELEEKREKSQSKEEDRTKDKPTVRRTPAVS